MEAIGAIAASTQLVAYAFNTASRLLELYKTLRHGATFCSNESATVTILHKLIVRLIYSATHELGYLLPLPTNIEQTATQLTTLLSQDSWFELIAIVFIRRSEINKAFASLERQKSDLLLQMSEGQTTILRGIRTSIATMSENQSKALIQIGEPQSRPQTSSGNRPDSRLDFTGTGDTQAHCKDEPQAESSVNHASESHNSVESSNNHAFALSEQKLFASLNGNAKHKDNSAIYGSKQMIGDLPQPSGR